MELQTAKVDKRIGASKIKTVFWFQLNEGHLN
ncbi:MAG: hypothetical protein RIS10_1129 [Pseudomonadota bacterium]|jgi:hypothetical protein